MALTGRAAGLTLALLRRGAGLRGTGLRGADWPLRPLAEVDGFPRPPDLGRGTGVVVRVATVVTVRERHAGITRHTPAERPNLATTLAVLCQARNGEAQSGPDRRMVGLRQIQDCGVHNSELPGQHVVVELDECGRQRSALRLGGRPQVTGREVSVSHGFSNLAQARVVPMMC